MSTANAAEVLLQDGPQTPQVNAEELIDAEPKPAGEEIDPQAKPNTGENETEEKKRLGGWQRKIAKLEKQNEELVQALTRAKPAEPPPPRVDDEPKLPALSTFMGTVEEYDKAVAEYPAKHAAYLDSRRQAQETQKQQGAAVADLSDNIAKLPEFEQMKQAVKGVPDRLANFIVIESAKRSNGAEVVREALLDEETRNDLIRMEKANDAVGISALLSAVSHGLRLAAKQSAAPEKKEPPVSQAPAPPKLVGKTTATSATELSDDLPYKEWKRRREAQLKARA